MTDQVRKARLETEAIVLGYAMSRLDRKYLQARQLPTWKTAFAEAAAALSTRSSSIKNLRDEFDPIHPNSRQGWHQRPLRESRVQVAHELKDVGDAGLLELVARIIGRDEEPIRDAIDVLASLSRPVHNVAERLLTGRRAEEFFLDNCESILQINRSSIVDCRLMACGYDFGIANSPGDSIEVKGMKGRRGEVLFTDREWGEAESRGDHYWLVVVGRLDTTPHPLVVQNPYSKLQASCEARPSLTLSWRAAVSIR